MSDKQSFPHTIKDRVRFEKYVDKTRADCWLWTGAKSWNGYGLFRLKNKQVRAHRFALYIFDGLSIPPEIVVMHSCDNPSCVNPMHLSRGSGLDNIRDRNAKGRTAFGERVATAKLNSEIVKKIRSDSRGARPVALELGVARSLVQRIRQRKHWDHV